MNKDKQFVFVPLKRLLVVLPPYILVKVIRPLVCWLFIFSCAFAFPLVHAADRALLIGVSEYEHSRISSLPGVRTDLKLMRELLINRFGVAESAIKELRDEQATHAGILGAIDRWLIQGSRPGDRIFLHYSGHGSYVPDLNGDESGPNGDGVDETIVAYDAFCRSRRECQNMVLDDEISERLKRLSDRYVITVFDSCNSGTATRSMRFGNTDLGDATARLLRPEAFVSQNDSASTRSMPSLQGDSSNQIANHKNEGGFVEGLSNQVNLFAVQSFQLALEVTLPGSPRGGLFTRNIYDALNQKNADLNHDGAVSFSELHEHITTSTRQYCDVNKASCKAAGGLNPRIEVPARLTGMDVFEFGKSSQSPVNDDLDKADITSILAQSNDANLRIALKPSVTLKPGDQLEFQVSADRSGVLMLFDFDASNKLTMLYPSDDTPSFRGNPPGWVQAGRTVLVPDDTNNWEYVITPPYGQGVVFAILAERYHTYPDTRTFDVVGREDDTHTEPPVDALGQLRIELDRLVSHTDNAFLQGASEWSMVAVEYGVVRE